MDYEEIKKLINDMGNSNIDELKVPQILSL